MKLSDVGEGRTVSLSFHVQLTPPVKVPVGEETKYAAQIANQLRRAGEAVLKTVCESQGYDVSTSSTYVIY